jgi:hypothetical protein
LADALAFADAATVVVLHLRDHHERDGERSALAGPIDSRAEVHQATGMITVQLGISALAGRCCGVGPMRTLRDVGCPTWPPMWSAADCASTTASPAARGSELMTSREQVIATTFVALADTLVADFDVIDFLHTLAMRGVELLDASEVGIMLAGQQGGLQVMASSTEEARLLELYELQSNEGPCLDCFRSGLPVAREDLPAMRSSWPMFTQRLQQLGFNSAQAVPMRLRSETIGALNILRTDPGLLPGADLRIGQAMAHVATVGLLQERAIAARELLATQLQTALNSRIQLEQAKGVLAERAGLQMDEAFTVMRDYARSHNRRLGKVAAQVIDGSIDDDVLRPGWRRSP